MIFVGLVIGWIGAGILVVTPSPSILLPIGFLACLSGLVIMTIGAFTAF